MQGSLGDGSSPSRGALQRGKVAVSWGALAAHTTSRLRGKFPFRSKLSHLAVHCDCGHLLRPLCPEPAVPKPTVQAPWEWDSPIHSVGHCPGISKVQPSVGALYTDLTALRVLAKTQRLVHGYPGLNVSVHPSSQARMNPEMRVLGAD